jgi:hypothetical protein
MSSVKPKGILKHRVPKPAAPEPVEEVPIEDGFNKDEIEESGSGTSDEEEDGDSFGELDEDDSDEEDILEMGESKQTGPKSSFPSFSLGS